MKKRHFQVVSLFLIIVMLASALASCVSNDEEDKETKASQKITEKASETQNDSLNNGYQNNNNQSNGNQNNGNQNNNNNTETNGNNETNGDNESNSGNESNAGNGTSDGNETNDGNDNNGNNEDRDGELTVFKNRAYTAKVIRSDTPSAIDKSIYNDIRMSLKDITDIHPTLETDYIVSGTEKYDGPAILIGSTNYKETKELYDTLEGVQAKAALIGNKYVLVWNDETMGEALLEEFNKKLKALSTTDTIVITSEWNITLTEEHKEDTGFDESGLATNIILPDINTTGITWNTSGRDAGHGSKIYIANNATSEHFTKYVTALKNAGFTLYTTNTLDTNEFATFVTKEQIVHVMFFPAKRVIKVTVDPRNSSDPSMRFALPGLESENTYTKTNTATEFVQLGMKQVSDSQENGMGYLVKLTDGRFVIVDAGYAYGANGGANSAKFLIDTMKKMQGNDNKPVIAAWILTHIHTDHVGGFMGMANAYANQVTIEKFIYNQPSDQQMNAVSNMNGRKNWIPDAIKKLTNAGSLKSVVKAHPGMQFFFCDLTITIMGSIDLIYDSNNTKMKNGNDSSVVSMFDISGVKFLLTGDAEPQEGKIIRDIYGGITKTDSVLKADFIQVPHHGYGNTNTDSASGNDQNAINVMASGGATTPGSSPIYAFVPVGLANGKEPAGYYDAVKNMDAMQIFPADHRIVAYNKNCTIKVTPDGKYTIDTEKHTGGFLIGTWSTY